MISASYQQSLEAFNPDLFSMIRRSINAIKQKQVKQKKSALQQLLKIIVTEKLPGSLFQQIGHMAIKDILKCFSDSSEMCRQFATNIVIQILPRSERISSFLPYIFSILVDRTNCHDLEGTSNLPEKMRPPPGQKPKVLMKIVQNCQQIRILYCQLLRTIVRLLEHEGDEVRKYLDDLINITRALIMDPAPQVQKMACETLEMICKIYKDLLLHYTEIMGRAVLLPLISKKSKIRIAGLKTLNAILWCGLYKYNAFVFENLIGFRDPNSVPIKDFYQPSHNINYLATFITDPNNKVRIEFMNSIKMWICDLNDKYDHHGKLVPYLLSGLFDSDEQVQRTALQAIDEIGRQIETERQKDFRQNKQFAIDAKWTWDGKLVNLSVAAPLKQRPSLGSRFFIRGHVRKFWTALYREVRDIKMQNRFRACNLAVYGAIFTENYLTQYLDNMIPQLLTAVIPHQKGQAQCCKMIESIFYYIGRYCEQSSYLHIMKSALQGKVVQNEEFIKASLKGLARIVQGSLQAVPQEDGLCHKKQQIIDLLSMISESGAIQQIYNYNCKEIQQFVTQLLKGLEKKAKKQQVSDIFDEHLATILKLWSVGYYEEKYLHCFKLDIYEKDQGSSSKVVDNLSINLAQDKKVITEDKLVQTITKIQRLYPQKFMDSLQQYLSDLYQNPPSLMDSDFKLIIVLNNYLIKSWSENGSILFSLTKQIIGESLSYNRSVEILNFCFKYISWLWDERTQDLVVNAKKYQTEEEHKKLQTSTSMYKQLSQIVERCMSNLNKFKPQKKVPVYDQHLIQPQQKEQDADIMQINEDTFLILFSNASTAFRKFYLSKTQLTNSVFGQIIESYLNLSMKARRTKQGTLESIKTLWVIFERQNIDEDFPQKILFKDGTNSQVKVIPKLIDFIVERIQTLGEPDNKKIPMLFSILCNCLKFFPVFANAATQLPLIYPDYNSLFQKLIKYAIDQKDVELKQKLIDFLRKSSKKMRPWFELEYKMATQGDKFIKAQFLKGILNV